MRLTKPAAAFMQIMGICFSFAGLVFMPSSLGGGLLFLALGIAMLVWGGKEARARMRE